MAPIRRMQSEPGQGVFPQTRGQPPVPPEAYRPPPSTAHAVDQRLRSCVVTGTQIKHAAQPRRVGKPEVSRRLLGLVAEQPRRGDETDHFQPRPSQLLPPVLHPVPRRLIAQIIKLALTGRVVLGDNFPGESPASRGLPPVVEPVQYNLVPLGLHPAKPAQKSGILVDVRPVVVVGHHQQRSHPHPRLRQIA